MDKQDEFDKGFGKGPVFLVPNPASVDGSTSAKLLLDFSALYRLDVHLHACREFYVGTSNIEKKLGHRNYVEKYLTYTKNGKISMVNLSLMIPISYPPSFSF